MGIKNKIEGYFKWLKLRKKGVKIQWGASVNASRIEKDVILSEHSLTSNSIIGSYTSVGRYTKIYNSEVGKFCSISWDVTVGATSHPLNHISTHAFPYVPYAGRFTKQNKQVLKKTVIGNDVWIGCNSVILPGIKIGTGAVIGAGAVVTKDVPPYAVVVGVPAKVMSYRFSEKQIEQLLELCWWDFPKEKIIDHIELFQKEFNAEVLQKLFIEDRN